MHLRQHDVMNARKQPMIVAAKANVINIIWERYMDVTYRMTSQEWFVDILMVSDGLQLHAKYL